MKRLLGISFISLSLLLVGCGGGHSAAPPTDVKVVPGDTSATISWSQDPGIEYWVWVAQGPSVSTSNCAGTASCTIHRAVSSPLILTGLTNGTTYSVTVNARTGGGPGGTATDPIAFVPRIAGTEWTAGATLGSGNMLGLAFAGTTTAGVNTLVAVGAAGAVYYSPNSVNWVAEASNVTANLNAAVYANSLFLAVGDSGTMVTSPDGVTWTAQTPQTAQNLYSVTTNGSGTVVAVGAKGTILVSTNSTTWAPANSTTSVDLYGIYFANGLYVAVGANGAILTSPDAGAWTAIAPVTSANLRSVSYGAPVATATTTTATAVWVVVGDGGSLVTSSDGVTWTGQLPIASSNLTSVVHGTQFITVGSGGTIFTSVDGIAWLPAVSGKTQDLRAVTFTVLTAGSIGVGYVAVGDAGTNLSAF